MHSRDLAELGAWIAIASRTSEQIFEFRSQAHSDLYWICSKRRLGRWNDALALFRSDLENPSAVHSPWHAITVFAEEIFLSEVLTRIWSAVLLDRGLRPAVDRKPIGGLSDRNENELVAHSILVGHIEASNQAQRLILDFADSSPVGIDRLNQLRRQTGRWTDLFLSFLPNVGQAAAFGHDSNRVRDFAEDQLPRSGQFLMDPLQLSAVTFQTAISQLTGKLSSNPDLNRNIALGVLSSLTTDAVHMEIAPSQKWQLRLESNQIDAQLLLDQLIAEEGLNSVL